MEIKAVLLRTGAGSGGLLRGPDGELIELLEDKTVTPEAWRQTIRVAPLIAKF
jgi:hypothetical protein